MGLFHRVLNITAGLAAGYLACKLLEDYNKDRPIEGEFLEVTPQPQETAPGQAQPAAPGETAPQETLAAPELQAGFAEKAPAECAAQPAECAAQPAGAALNAAPAADAPNPNPVRPGNAPTLAPAADGKIDPTKIADSADFASWDELGCQS